jgi:c-di-GMP-binding flagellar brake protein YcgR
MVAVRHDAMYATNAAVEALDRAPVPLVKLACQTWERVQRRAAVRASVAVRPRVAQVMSGPARRESRLGVTDISATGLQVRSRDELRPGDLLELAFELDGEVEVKARVRRVYCNDRVWVAGCEFEGIAESVSQRIMQFIFAQQRAVLRARRGLA